MIQNCISKNIFLNKENILTKEISIQKYTHIIYDVLRVQNMIALFQEEHSKRFFNSFTLLNIPPPFSSEFLKNAINSFLKTEGIKEGNIKISYYLGDTPTFVIYQIPHKYPQKKDYTNGVASDILFAERETPNIKQELSIREIANKEIANKKLYDIILCDKNGILKEGSRTNLFFIKNNELFTAKKEDVLIGITREKVISIALELNITVNELNINKEDLPSFNAAFFTGTSPKILPISNIGNIKFKPQTPTLLKLMRALDKKIDVYLQLNKL